MNLNRVAIVLLLLSLTTFAFAEEKVYRGVKPISGGVEKREIVHLDLGDEELPSKTIDKLRLLPRLETLVLGGPRYTDRHLEQISRIDTLRAIVLDSTDVSDEAIAELRIERPELVVHRSQRWAIEQIGNLALEATIRERVSDAHPNLRKILGDNHFKEAIRVDFGRLPDLESGPFDPIMNEQLSPLRKLTTLTYLDLSWTRLNDAGMHFLKELTRLEVLDLPLGEVSAEGMASLRHLKKLRSFSGSPLSDDGLAHIGTMKRLESLTTGGLHITDEGLIDIGELKQLKFLQLNETGIRGEGLRHLGGLTQLERIHLDHSELDDLSHVPDLPSLRYLHISSTAVDNASMKALSRCKNLETLWLMNTDVGDNGVVHLKSLRTLRDLNLQGTPVSDAGIKHLSQIPGLRSLNVSQTKITIEGLQEFANFVQLERLNIQGLPLDEKGLKHLKQLTQLKRLSVTIPLENHDFEARHKKYERLRNMLPNCVVQ